MTPRQRTPWSKVIEESGISVRIYERVPGSQLYREVRLDGGKDRKSLGHTDRALPERQAHELARRLAELRLTGHTGSVTLGQLVRLYQQHRLPLLGSGRMQRARDCIRYFTAHLGDRFAVTDLSQTHVDTHAAARRAGTLGNPRCAEAVRGVRDGTIGNDLVWLGSLFNFGCSYRIGGRPLLMSNPMRWLTLPKERNVRRPVASDERYRRTLAKADQADPTLARHMPHGAIRWRAEYDKQGYEDVAPISSQARAALELYLRAHPRVRDTWMLPQLKAPARPMKAPDARLLRLEAEGLAELPLVDRVGFHAYRRLYAVERKHLADVDVARSAGWRDLATMKRSYQQADPITTLRVIDDQPESEVSGHTSDTPQKASGDTTTA